MITVTSILARCLCYSLNNPKEPSKTGNAQKNSKYKLYSDRDETITHIISEYSKPAQDFKNRFDWVWKIIHWELYKKRKFKHINKSFMHNRKVGFENKLYKIL